MSSKLCCCALATAINREVGSSPWPLVLVVAFSLLQVQKSSCEALDLVEPAGVAGLSVSIQGTNVALAWPSVSSERFVVLWRPEVSVESRWIELTNQMPAPSLTNLTTFLDSGAISRGPAMLTNASLAGFYRVFVIPDFWFNMNGVELVGGPDCGEDFLPYYNGSKETWDWLKPQITLLVDGEPSSFEKLLFFSEEAVERVNFGTRKKPHWAYARGLWFAHDTLPNGEHTLQLRALLALNNLVEGCQYVTFTNQPVRVRLNNEISFPDWQPFIQGKTYTFTAHVATRRVYWRIDVYDLGGRLLIRKTGRTTNGEIRWDWDLRDKYGRLHDDFDTDFSFKSHITTWPLDGPIKCAQALIAKEDAQDRRDWWTARLGRDFVRRSPWDVKAEKRSINQEPLPFESQAVTRPLELSLYHDDKAYWSSRPPIDVPISLPEPKQTNAPILVPSQTLPKPSPRPFIPFDAPKKS